MTREHKIDQTNRSMAALGFCGSLTLSLLLAEMKALEALLPGLGAKAQTLTGAEAEDEVEAGFDNMPV